MDVRSRPSPRRSRCAAALLAALLAACAPATDRDRYEVGETGVVTFQNLLSPTVYLGGCNHFAYEKRAGDEWIWQGSDLACVWEGFAQPVPHRGVVTDLIRAREPGTWRLRYVVGAGCSETAPLTPAHCDVIEEITSNEFEVTRSSCKVGGCSSQLCGEADDDLVSTCEWREVYGCYRDARCGRFGPGDTCAWEPTPELLACIAEHGDSALGPITLDVP
jgi:hypothetical protein